MFDKDFDHDLSVLVIIIMCGMAWIIYRSI